MKKKNIMYADLKIDIPTLNGIMVEKFIAPYRDNDDLWYWRDNKDEHHSFNGMPAYIRQDRQEYVLIWFKHGEKVHSLIINKKLEHEIIADKRKNRNFTKTNSNDKNSRSNQ